MIKPIHIDSIRNHQVLSIAVDESRIFVTKTRAPFMICVEMYRPGTEEAQVSGEGGRGEWFIGHKGVAEMIKEADEKISKTITVKKRAAHHNCKMRLESSPGMAGEEGRFMSQRKKKFMSNENSGGQNIHDSEALLNHDDEHHHTLK